MDKIELNPEIKKKADELFELIEKEVNEKHEDSVAEAMAAEWGDYLKTSKGFDMLKYGEELTLTESERAIYGLEDSFRFMNDEAAHSIATVSRNVMRMVNLWNFNSIDQDLENLAKISGALMMAKDAAVDIEKDWAGLFDYRALSYREEIEELKKAV